MADGIGMELEQIGVVALIGLLVVPGMAWAAKAKSGPAMLGRAAILAGVVGAALLVERALDSTANAAIDTAQDLA